MIIQCRIGRDFFEFWTLGLYLPARCVKHVYKILFSCRSCNLVQLCNCFNGNCINCAVIITYCRIITQHVPCSEFDQSNLLKIKSKLNKSDHSLRLNRFTFDHGAAV